MTSSSCVEADICTRGNAKSSLNNNTSSMPPPWFVIAAIGCLKDKLRFIVVLSMMKNLDSMSGVCKSLPMECRAQCVAKFQQMLPGNESHWNSGDKFDLILLSVANSMAGTSCSTRNIKGWECPPTCEQMCSSNNLIWSSWCWVVAALEKHCTIFSLTSMAELRNSQSAAIFFVKSLDIVTLAPMVAIL